MSPKAGIRYLDRKRKVVGHSLDELNHWFSRGTLPSRVIPSDPCTATPQAAANVFVRK